MQTQNDLANDTDKSAFLLRLQKMFESIHFTGKGRATTNASKPEVLERLRDIVGAENVIVDPEKVEPYGADAVKEKFPPEAVLIFPRRKNEHF